MSNVVNLRELPTLNEIIDAYIIERSEGVEEGKYNDFVNSIIADLEAAKLTLLLNTRVQFLDEEE